MAGGSGGLAAGGDAVQSSARVGRAIASNRRAHRPRACLRASRERYRQRDAAPRLLHRTGWDPPAAALCEKINPNAVELSVAWGGFQSWRHYYTQSDCFYQVGANGKAPDVCDRVREFDVPPMRFHLSRSREDRLTKAECQQKAIQDGGSGGEYGTELMMLLLGYSPEEIAAGGRGYPPEHGGAYEFKRTQLDGGGDTGQDYSRLPGPSSPCGASAEFLARRRRRQSANWTASCPDGRPRPTRLVLPLRFAARSSDCRPESTCRRRIAEIDSRQRGLPPVITDHWSVI